MKLKTFSVFDKLTREFAPPFFQKTNNAAYRSFQNMLKESKIEDIENFELYEIGSFDSETGEIEHAGHVLVDSYVFDDEDN